MKVLYLSHRLPYAPNRGDRVRAFHTLQHLSRLAEMHVLSLATAEDAELAADMSWVSGSVTAVQTARLGNALRAAKALLTGRPLTHALLNGDGLAQQMKRLMETVQPDVVLAFCSGIAWLLDEPSADAVPVVVDMVDVDSQKWNALAKSAAWPRSAIYACEAKVLARFEAALTARAHHTFVVTEDERQAMLKVNPSANVAVVPNGVDVDALRPRSLPTASNDVVFCGVMNYEPNVDAITWFCAEAWPRIRHALPAAIFRIVGSHPAKVVRDLNSSEMGIEVVGAVDDVRPYLWRAAVSVAPLRIARGIQNKIQEAVAAGLPVVATTAALKGTPPAVTAACVQADSPAEIADAVVRLLRQSPEQRSSGSLTADLSGLTWSSTLAPVFSILEKAALSRP